MPDAGGADAPEDGRPPQRAMLSMIAQFAAIYFIVQRMSSGIGESGSKTTAASNATESATGPPTDNSAASPPQKSELMAQYQSVKDMFAPEPYVVRSSNGIAVKPSKPLQAAWRLDTSFSLLVYTSAAEKLSLRQAKAGEEGAELWASEEDLSLSMDDSNKRTITKDWALPDHVRIANSSLNLHAYFLHSAYHPEHSDEMTLITAHYPLVSWRWETVAEEGRSLLGKSNYTSTERSLLGWLPWGKGSEDEQQEKNGEKTNHAEKGEGAEDNDTTDTGSCAADDETCRKEPSPSSTEINPKGISRKTHRSVQLLAPELQLEFVPDASVLKIVMLPPPIAEIMTVTNDQNFYLPWASFSDFWLLRRDLIEVNETVTDVKIKINVTPVGMKKFLMMKQTDYMLSKQMKLGGQGEDDANTVKETILETNPWLLGLTVLVSLAHTVLEFLAFSSDIKHWRTVKSMEGVSVRSMFWKVGMEVVIFLYLLDNDTSFMILAGSGVGTLIEVWKLGKAVRPRNFGGVKLLGFIPWFELEESESYSKSTTKEYDNTAMKYLAYILYPLVVGYSMYSLVVNKHRSWYSWLLSSLVGAVYMFGFIMMFPQIFINYKLKSVAHLPLKAFMYKALNTVIDDLFSFIIKMPLMHRLACFRDDIVFIAFLYQRWQYPVDKTRVNEYGQSFVEQSKKKKKVVRVKKLVVRRNQPRPSGATETTLSVSSVVVDEPSRTS